MSEQECRASQASAAEVEAESMRWPLELAEGGKFAVRWLTLEERQELRSDMAEASAWARTELRKRRAAKNQKNSAHVMDDGIEKVYLSD
ncbi:hypothetical protein [Proteus mirabilis]|uniref:hypothetical protein n=1 Tax=Proteus mirabilis TaxID=584 RepID=UPI002281B013|nr:hypothetical protein [Proteus mirabilis]